MKKFFQIKIARGFIKNPSKSTNEQIFQIIRGFLFFLLGLWTSSSFADASSQDRKESRLAITPPAAPDDPEFRKNFLKSLRKIAEGEFSPESISSELGWPIWVGYGSNDPEYRRVNFKLYKNHIIAPEFTQWKEKGIKRLSSNLLGYICLTREDVLQEFGHDFKKSILHDVSGYTPKSKEEAVEIRRNLDTFLWGPMYSISNSTAQYGVNFMFVNSVCANNFGISQPKDWN